MSDLVEVKVRKKVTVSLDNKLDVTDNDDGTYTIKMTVSVPAYSPDPRENYENKTNTIVLNTVQFSSWIDELTKMAGWRMAGWK